MVHGLEDEYWGQIDFVYLDTDESATRTVANEYAAYGQPVFVFIDAEGNQIAKWRSMNEREMREAFDSYLASAGG